MYSYVTSHHQRTHNLYYWTCAYMLTYVFELKNSFLTYIVVWTHLYECSLTLSDYHSRFRYICGIFVNSVCWLSSQINNNIRNEMSCAFILSVVTTVMPSSTCTPIEIYLSSNVLYILNNVFSGKIDCDHERFTNRCSINQAMVHATYNNLNPTHVLEKRKVCVGNRKSKIR